MTVFFSYSSLSFFSVNTAIKGKPSRAFSLIEDKVLIKRSKRIFLILSQGPLFQDICIANSLGRERTSTSSAWRRRAYYPEDPATPVWSYGPAAHCLCRQPVGLSVSSLGGLRGKGADTNMPMLMLFAVPWMRTSFFLVQEFHVFPQHPWNYSRLTCQLAGKVKSQTFYSSWH